MSSASLPAPGAASPARWRDDAEIIGLVGVAHGVSHFYQLVLPPLFPWLRAEFGWSWAMLGAISTVFFVVSGIGQAAAGFVVDRFGARRTLLAGMASMVAGAAVAASADGYVALLLAAVLTGLGNCVMHPADYAVLNSKVSTPRLGHAFSMHGLTGNLGYAAAPALMFPLATAFGWRTAVAVGALAGLVVVALILLRPASFEVGTRPASHAAAPAAARRGWLPAWITPSVALCFLFFVTVTLANVGVQNFAPQAMTMLYGLGPATAAAALTAWLMSAACGMFVGGFAAQASARLERIVACSLAGCAALLGWLATGTAPAAAVVPVLVAGGFLVGLVGPSRDMLVRRSAPPGVSGRVFGIVYSGIDVGAALGPAALGAMLDHGRPGMAVATAAVALAGGVAVAIVIAAVQDRPSPRREAC